MNGAPLTIVVVAALMAVMAGGYGAAWVVHRLMAPSVDRGASICAIMLGPVGAVGIVAPQWFTLGALWVAGVVLGVLWEMSRADREMLRRSLAVNVHLEPEVDAGDDVVVLNDEERRRFHEEIDAYRGAR